MRFPNAYKGIKKIFTAEILGLIGSIGLIATAVLAMLALEERSDALLIATGACAVFAGVFMLISYILNIVGLSQASHDDDSFRSAFYISIFGIVFSVLSAFLGNVFRDNVFVTRSLNIIPDLINLFIMVMVIVGIRTLSRRMGDPVMEGKGENIIRLLFVMGIVILAARFILIIFTTTFAGALAVSMVCFAGILSVITYILYLIYLAKAKKMLAPN